MIKKNAPDEDVAAAGVVLDHLLDAGLVVAVARGVDREPEVGGERCDRVVGALARAVCRQEKLEISNYLNTTQSRNRQDSPAL